MCEKITEAKIEKIKASSAEIIVHGTKEKPYYEIKYFDLSDNEWKIGYGSYKLEFVIAWKEVYFEIVDDESINKIMSNDLISRKEVIKAVDRHTTEDEKLDEDISVILEEIPTAYNVDAVCREIQQFVDNPCTLHECGVRSEHCNICMAKKILEIVQKGGDSNVVKFKVSEH